MNFGQALEAMKRGHVISRKAWSEGSGLRLASVDGKFVLQRARRHNTFDPCFVLSAENLLAEDWKENDDRKS